MYVRRQEVKGQGSGTITKLQSWGGSGICLDGLMTYSDANIKKRLSRHFIKIPAVVIMLYIML